MTLEELWDSLERGARWLAGHDPTGAFTTWFRMGLTERSPMPAQPQERIDAWRLYYRQRRIFENGRRQMEQMERAAKLPPGAELARRFE